MSKSIQKSKYIETIEEVFQHTQDEMFMGGKLLHAHHITDKLIFIESERRMDANMIATLRNFLKGSLKALNSRGNVAVYECDSKEYTKYD